MSGDKREQVQAIHQQYERWNEGKKPSFFPSFRDYWPHMDKVYREISGGEGEP